jgi:formamidopyrimidine-DNA glycosylase
VAAVAGRTVVDVEVTGARTVRRYGPEGLVAGLRGRRLEAVDRHGKYLLVRTDAGTTVVAHLRMTGQLLVSPPGPRAPHTHAVATLDDGRELRFVDPRTFGELFVARPGLPELAGLGPDALDPGLGARQLRDALHGRRAPVKAVLADQRRLAGLGAIYTDEVLHVAGVHPLREGGALGRTAQQRLLAAIPAVLGAAIEAGGSSLADQQYVDVFGRTGRYQEQHRVYARAGQPCLRCGGTIERVRRGALSAYLCRRCQR